MKYLLFLYSVTVSFPSLTSVFTVVQSLPARARNLSTASSRIGCTAVTLRKSSSGSPVKANALPSYPIRYSTFSIWLLATW